MSRSLKSSPKMEARCLPIEGQNGGSQPGFPSGVHSLAGSSHWKCCLLCPHPTRDLIRICSTGEEDLLPLSLHRGSREAHKVTDHGPVYKVLFVLGTVGLCQMACFFFLTLQKTQSTLHRKQRFWTGPVLAQHKATNYLYDWGNNNNKDYLAAQK